jgi:hypothetical protein
MKCPEPTLLKDKDLLTGITDKIGTKGFADLDRRGTNPSVYAGCAHFLPSFGPPLVPPYSPGLVKETSARVHAGKILHSPRSGRATVSKHRKRLAHDEQG